MKNEGMERVRIAVCEDDGNDRHRLCACLKAELEDRCLNAEIQAFGTGGQLLEAEEKLPFQIYFLDIILPGKNGVEMARILRGGKKNSAIVFITSSRDYYAEGFEVGAAHYLVKPFTDVGIAEALDRCLCQVGKRERYIDLTVDRMKCRILLSDLVWAESKDKVCILHARSGEYRTYLKLNELERLLKDRRFLRCHRSFLINMDEVADMKNGFFYMSDASVIPARQMERARLREAYEDYLFEKMRGRR